MYSKRIITQKLMAVTVLALALGACVKQRDELNVQGANLDNLQPGIQSPNSLWQASSTNENLVSRPTDYKITTSDVIKLSQDSIAQRMVIEAGAPIKHLDIVGFSSNHPHLQDVNIPEIAEMLGEKEKTYPIWEALTPNFLVIQKFVTNDEISFIEKTYAQQQGEGWLVPIGGFAVSYYNLERIRNEDNRETNLVNKYYVQPEQFRSATHYELNSTRFVRFDRQPKVDTLQRNFFDGEWYFSETTVDVRSGVAQDVGDLGATDTSFATATKIRFRIEDSFLVGDNTNIDERYQDGEDLVNQASVIKIPINLVDYRPEYSNGQQLQEVEDDNKDESQRRYMKVEFLKNETTKSAYLQLFDRIFGRLTDFKTLLEVTYGEGYVSLLILDANSDSIKRFSFRKVTPNDTPANVPVRRYFLDDWQKFGVFFTEKIRKYDFQIATQEDQEREIRMARHNPTRDIVYHFTDQTPKDAWYRNMGREAINIWNQAFQKAGLDIHVRVDESKDVPLGDIRYNVIHIVNKTIGGNLGFGPSLTDADTGLIVSSSMNLTMEDINERHYSAVRNYLGRRSGKYYNFKTYEAHEDSSARLQQLFTALNRSQISTTQSGALTLLGYDGLTSDKTALDPNVFTDSEKEMLRRMSINPAGTIKDVRRAFYSQMQFSHRYQNAHMFNLLTTGSLDAMAQNYSSTEVNDKFIDDYCPEVKTLANRMSGENVATAEEIRIIDPCVKMLSQSEGLWATIHELGHNLGLMHNFQGSADPENFPSLTDYTFNYLQYPQGLFRRKTSSAMDYLTTEGRQLTPGKYDIAAIRWIYAQKLELKDGSIVSVPVNQSLKDSGFAERMKPFKYCNDYDRGTSANPLCRAFDEGVNLVESAQYAIESAYNSLSYNYRYDRVNASPTLADQYGQIHYSTADYAILAAGTHLKTIYDQWRGYLRRHVGSTKSYLEDYTSVSYEQKIRELSASDPVVVEQYLTVRNMIVKFLLDITLLSNKYCLIVDNVSNKEKLVELEKIRTELVSAEAYSTVNSCSSPAALAFIEAQKATLKKEFGYFLTPGKFELDPQVNFLDPYDFAGTILLRNFAQRFLTQRITPATKLVDENFLPSMLDEPDIRSLLQTALVKRLTQGVPIAEATLPSGETHIGRLFDYSVVKKDLFNTEDLVQGDLASNYKLKVFHNYSREKEFLSVFVDNLKTGLVIPGGLDDGRRGYVEVNAAPASQMDGITRIATNYIDYLGTIFYVRNNNSLGGQLMTRINELDTLQDLSSFTPQAIAAARLNATVELNKLEAIFQPLTSYTLKDVGSLAVKVLNRAQELTQEDPANSVTVYIMQKLVEPEVAIFSAIIGRTAQAQGIEFSALVAILNADVLPSDVNPALAQILSQPASIGYEQLKQGGVEANPATLNEMNRRYDQFLTEHTGVYNDYTFNAEEYIAQKDLLERIILILAQ